MKELELAPWTGARAIQLHAQRLLAQQINHMEYVRVVAKEAIDELSSTHSYSEWKLATTLALTAQLKQTRAGSMTPEEQAVYHSLEVGYLNTMEQFSKAVATQLLADLERTPAELGSSSPLDQVIAILEPIRWLIDKGGRS